MFSFIYVLLAAQTTTPGTSYADPWLGCLGEKGVVTLKCIPVVFQNIVSAALLFSGVVALFFIIFSGIKLMLSRGDPKQVEAAHHTLTYALLGLVLILLSFTIINLISYITRVDCIKLFGFSNCQ